MGGGEDTATSDLEVKLLKWISIEVKEGIIKLLALESDTESSAPSPWRLLASQGVRLQLFGKPAPGLQAGSRAAQAVHHPYSRARVFLAPGMKAWPRAGAGDRPQPSSPAWAGAFLCPASARARASGGAGPRQRVGMGRRNAAHALGRGGGVPLRPPVAARSALPASEVRGFHTGPPPDSALSCPPVAPLSLSPSGPHPQAARDRGLPSGPLLLCPSSDS